MSCKNAISSAYCGWFGCQHSLDRKQDYVRSICTFYDWVYLPSTGWGHAVLAKVLILGIGGAHLSGLVDHSNECRCLHCKDKDSEIERLLLDAGLVACNPAVSGTIERKWKDMNTNWTKFHANTCKCMEDDRTRMHTGGIYVRKMKRYECKLKDNGRKMMGNACKMKNMNATRKKHKMSPKHLKPTKQCLNPCPSLFRNEFWLHVCWFPQKKLESDKAPPGLKTYNHNNSIQWQLVTCQGFWRELI